MNINELKGRMRIWLGVISLAAYREDRSALIESHNELMARIGELELRVGNLDLAYAEDPRRKEIEKEKAAEPTSLGGFLPRSARRSRWEAERAAKPKS